MRKVLLLSLALLSAGCQDEGAGVVVWTDELPIEVDLHVGQTVRFSDQDFAVTFEKVTAEGRCPINAMCIWQGDAAVKLVVQHLNAPAEICTLHTTLTPRSIVVGGLEITLKGLQPYPSLGDTLNPLQYVARLEIAHAFLLD
jgi:hypothetical protein